MPENGFAGRRAAPRTSMTRSEGVGREERDAARKAIPGLEFRRTSAKCAVKAEGLESVALRVLVF